LASQDPGEAAALPAPGLVKEAQGRLMQAD
jgi:hypothetical protein